MYYDLRKVRISINSKPITMQDKIIAAIAEYLYHFTESTNNLKKVRFLKAVRHDKTREDFLQETATEIYTALAPLVEAGEPDWKDAPEWAEWHVTTEFMGEIKNTWYENLQVASRTRQVGTKSDVRRHLNWGHVIGTIYRRPK